VATIGKLSLAQLPGSFTAYTKKENSPDSAGITSSFTLLHKCWNTWSKQ